MPNVSRDMPGSDPDLLTILPSHLACSLDGAEIGDRIEEWSQALTGAVRSEPIDGGLKLTFPRSYELAGLVDLVMKEQTCCSFLSFNLGIDANAVTLEVTGPGDAQGLIDGPFRVSTSQT